MKVSQDPKACAAYDVHKVDLIHCADIRVHKAAEIGSGSRAGGGNSGFQALNLAVQFGAQRILLVGFDMRVDQGLHWHGPHPRGMSNPREINVTAWREGLDSVAAKLQALGVEVINCSPISALTAYPKMTLTEALAC